MIQCFPFQMDICAWQGIAAEIGPAVLWVSDLLLALGVIG